MEMLLRNITLPELAGMFERHAECSPAPHLVDPKAKARARRLAKKNGVWGDLTRNLDPGAPIPVIKRSDFRRYRRTGDRTVHQAREAGRQRELRRAALALWLGHPKAEVDYLQDLLWAYCDDWTWIMAAHEPCWIDLGSAMRAADLAEIVCVLDGRLEDEVKERVAAEIERRVFEPFSDSERADWWKTCRMNWNHVCNGGVIRAALYQVKDVRRLVHLLQPAILNMTYALDGFTDDGGCEEGPGYWNFGFGHYVRAAHALYMRTGGELDLMRGEKIERICRYPLAAQIAGPLRATFADAHHGFIETLSALLINEHLRLPELYGTCAQRADCSLAVRDMHSLALYRGQKAPAKPDGSDYLLPDLGTVKLRGTPGPQQLTLVALAGHNGVPHNHNDIGSFIVHKRGRICLVDPGAPLYTRKTFSPQRYEIIFCNSLGHSVPLINGREQRAGAQYRGDLTVENLGGEGRKTTTVDMTRAYPRGTVKRLMRTFTLAWEANSLTLEDAYEFSKPPRALEEAFITFEDKVVVAKNGRSVRLGPRRKGLTIKAAAPGRFRARRLVKESKEGHTDDVLTRITFTPRKLAKTMTLRFEIA